MSAERYIPDPESNEQRFIRLSLERAQAIDQPLSDGAARIIAGQLHGGQITAMYSLASCGAIDQNGLSREIAIDVTNLDTPDELIPWYEHVWRYAEAHSDRGPVAGWFELTRDERIAELLRELGDA